MDWTRNLFKEQRWGLQRWSKWDQKCWSLGLLGGQRFGFTDWILGGEVWGGDHTEIKKKKKKKRRRKKKEKTLTFCQGQKWNLSLNASLWNCTSHKKTLTFVIMFCHWNVHFGALWVLRHRWDCNWTLSYCNHSLSPKLKNISNCTLSYTIIISETCFRLEKALLQNSVCTIESKLQTLPAALEKECSFADSTDYDASYGHVLQHLNTLVLGAVCFFCDALLKGFTACY